MGHQQQGERVSSRLKRYRIVKKVVLGFNDPRDQYDILISAGELVCDGDTIWWDNEGYHRESITTVNAIDQWLEEGRIEEIQDA